MCLATSDKILSYRSYPNPDLLERVLLLNIIFQYTIIIVTKHSKAAAPLIVRCAALHRDYATGDKWDI